MTGDPDLQQPRFCPDCGRSRRPLTVPHVKRPCDDCGEFVYVVERGEGGGIKTRKGDTFTIPAGWLNITLRPKTGGGLYRPGAQMFVETIIASPFQGDKGEALDSIRKWITDTEESLRSRPALEDWDLDDPDQADRAYEHLKEEQHHQELWMLKGLAVGQALSEALDEDDTEEAAQYACLLAISHALIVYYQELEELVWYGYLHRQRVHRVGEASAGEPGEAQAIRTLQENLRGHDEALLRTWIDAGVDIASRLEVTELAAEVVRASVAGELERREREREDKRQEKTERREDWKLRLQGAGLAVTLVSAIAGLLRLMGIM